MLGMDLPSVVSLPPGKPGVSVRSVFNNLRALRVKQLVGQ